MRTTPNPAANERHIASTEKWGEEYRGIVRRVEWRKPTPEEGWPIVAMCGDPSRHKALRWARNEAARMDLERGNAWRS